MNQARFRYATVIALSVFLASVLPSLGLAWLLIQSHSEDVQIATESELTRIAQSAQVDMLNRYSNLITNVNLVSNDRTLSLALSDILYAGSAYNILERFSTFSESSISSYLVTQDFIVVEQHQGFIDAFEQSPVVRKIRREIAQNGLEEGQQLVLLIEDQELFFTPDGEEPISKGLAVINPIYNLAMRPEARLEAEGYMVSIASFQSVVDAQQGSLGAKDWMVLDYNGVVLASTHKPSSTLDGNDMVVRDTFSLSLPSLRSDLEFTVSVIRESFSSHDFSIYSDKLRLSFAGIVVISIILSLVIGRMISQPFQRMSQVITQFSDGNYRLEQPTEFKFEELQRLQVLLQTMGGRIEQQLFLMNKKNKQLEKVSTLKDHYLEEVKQFNAQLEKRVKEQTQEISQTLSHAQYHRKMLHTLLSLSYELQQCRSTDEVNQLCVAGLCRTLVSIPVAIMTRGAEHHSTSFLSSGIGPSEQEQLKHELDNFFAQEHSKLMETLELESSKYSLFPLAGVSQHFHGCIIIRSDELKAEVQDFMSLFARQVGAIVESIELNSELQLLARTDALTGLANRKAFNEAMLSQEELFERYPDDYFGLFIVDANGLKQMNDKFGHAQGDVLICRIGKILRDTVRGVDKLYRLAGDEFAILVHKGDIAACQILEQRLQKASQHHYMDLVSPEDNKSLRKQISFSVGFASTQETPYTELFRVADQAMYANKNVYYAQI